MVDKPFVTKVITSAVIIKDSKALILKRGKDEFPFPGLWEIPGGKKELGEDWETSLKREIKEETGLAVRAIMVINVFSYLIETEDDIRDATEINFLVKVTGGELKISKEHEEFAWVKEDELDSFNVSVSTKKAIKEGFAFIQKEGWTL